MKSTGATLTIGGGVMLVTGLAVLLNSSIETTYDGNGNYYEETTGNPVAGAVLYILGNASVGAGIPIWIVGKNNYKKYSDKLETVSFKLNADPRQMGATLSYRF